MSHPLPPFDIQQFNVDERLELISHLWDSLPDSTESLPIPEWHRQELEQRLAAADADPDATIPWDEVKKSLRNDT
jgi:putative addiction module component (TIGR02574 family)